MGLFRRLGRSAPDDKPVPLFAADPPAQAVPPPNELSVVQVDGIFHLQVTPDIAIPMWKDGEPLRHFGPGWRFHSLYAAFSPVLLIELEDEHSNRATWFFDTVPRFRGNTVAVLPASLRHTLVHHASRLLGDMVEALATSTPFDPAEISAFFAIDPSTRRQIFDACRDVLLPEAEIRLVDELPDRLVAHPNGGGGSAVLIERSCVSSALTPVFTERLVAGLDNGGLRWPSPVDGTPQNSSGCLVLSDFDFAYRVVDTAHDLVFFLLVTGHVASVCGLYFPSENLAVARDEANRQILLARFGLVSEKVLEHLCRYGDTLLPYLHRGPKAIAAFMREQHIGHQLWNELSGLDALVRQVPAASLPGVLVLGGRSTEFFGPLDEVFLELDHKARPDLQTLDQLIRFAHANDFDMARFTSSYVSKDLRDRILRRVRGSAIGHDVVAQRARHSGRVVVLGLRVENRTAVDLGPFLCRLVGHIARTAPGCHVVLDGQNCREGVDEKVALGSFADMLADRTPLEVELELCREIMASAVGLPITVTSTSGQTVATSIAWMHEAGCFIALWGAGLAKYRWVANKPGLVLTSHYHLTNPAEMSIYHSPEFMEDPTPLTYVSSDCVVDELDAQQLVPVAGPRHASFRVHEPAFFAEVSAYLAASVAALPGVEGQN